MLTLIIWSAIRRRSTEGEIAVATEFHGVEHLDALQSDILEIEHRVAGIGNLSFDVELVIAARGCCHCGQYHSGHLKNIIHIYDLFTIFGCKGTKKTTDYTDYTEK